jgi:hypothetical protein
MPDPFAKVSPGQLFEPHATWINTLSDVARRHLQDKALGGQSPVAPRLPQPSIVQVKNNSGAAVPRFGALGLDGPLFLPPDNVDEFKRVRVFSGVTPIAYTHRVRFVVLREPLAEDVIGTAWLGGAAQVKLSIIDAAQSLATVKDADATQLETTWGEGVPILWKESGTGTKWALVLLGTFDVGTGQYMGMNLTTTAQNVRGWDFQRAVALPGV